MTAPGAARRAARDLGHDLASAMAPRLEEDPLAVLGTLAEYRERLEGVVRGAVAELRAQGVSWGDIGTALGVSKQAATKRYGGRAPAAAYDGPSLLDQLDAPR